MGNKNKRLIVIIGLIVIGMIGFFLTKDLGSNQNEKDRDVVTISIHGPVGEPMILDTTKVSIKKGATVFEVLTDTLKVNKMQFEYGGGGKFAYVNGINNLYEFDKGPESGWMYKVDGVFPGKSCGMYELKSGQAIEWVYTVNLGKDVDAAEGTLKKQGE